MTSTNKIAKLPIKFFQFSFIFMKSIISLRFLSFCSLFCLFFIFGATSKNLHSLSKTTHWYDSIKQKRIEDSVKKAQRNKLLVFPLAAYSAETAFGIGFATAYIFKTKKSDTLIRTSTIPTGLIYTTRNQIIIGIGGNIFFPNEKYVLRFENTASKFPDRFWGIGNNSKQEAEEVYSYSQFLINPQLLRRVYKRLFVGGVVELQKIFDVEYVSKGVFENSPIYGKSGGLSMGLGAVISYDTRNHSYAPNKGSVVQISVLDFNHLWGSDFQHSILRFDVRKYFKTAPHQVLAFQLTGTFTDGQTHFRNLGILGSSTMMRGYYAGRYKDNHALALQAEYRFPVWGRFGGVTFASAGRVSDRVQNFSFDKLKYALGAGLRFALIKNEKLNLRLDYGLGFNDDNNQNTFKLNSTNLYVLISEAF
jgi:hypothetical protein